MTIEKISAILAKLQIMHESLLKMADYKTELITKGDIQGIDKMLKDEQSHIAAISQLESSRQQLVSAFFKEQGVDGLPTMEKLLSLLQEGPAKKRLKEVSQTLVQTVTALKEKNELNQSLLFNSLQVVNMTLDMMRPQQDNFNYGNSEGRRSSTSLGRFDSQA